jgi:hypothetical protein
MAAVATDFRDVLIRRVPAMITAVLGIIAGHCTYTTRMPTLVVIIISH